MDKENMEAQLKQMIVERLFLQVTPDELESDASLIDQYGVDSVCLLELVVGLEDEFGIVLDDGDFSIANFESVKAIANFIETRSA